MPLILTSWIASSLAGLSAADNEAPRIIPKIQSWTGTFVIREIMACSLRNLPYKLRSGTMIASGRGI